MSDGWENDHGLDPQDATGDDGADGDPDNDGLSNIDEYLNGTNKHGQAQCREYDYTQDAER